MKKKKLDLYEELMRELDWSPRLLSRGVSITDDGAAIVLTGEVESESERWGFELAAKRAMPARKVLNRLVVVPPTGVAGADAEFRKLMRM